MLYVVWWGVFDYDYVINLRNKGVLWFNYWKTFMLLLLKGVYLILLFKELWFLIGKGYDWFMIFEEFNEFSYRFRMVNWMVFRIIIDLWKWRSFIKGFWLVLWYNFENYDFAIFENFIRNFLGNLPKEKWNNDFVYEMSYIFIFIIIVCI